MVEEEKELENKQVNGQAYLLGNRETMVKMFFALSIKQLSLVSYNTV